jgi:hypothetical protein
MARQNTLTIMVVACAMSALPATGQRTLSCRLDWTATKPIEAGAVVKTSGGASTPWFAGARMDAHRQDLPYFHGSLELSPATIAFTVEISNATYSALSREEIDQLPGIDSPAEEPEVTGDLSWYRKRPVGLIDVYPYRRNSGTGQVEKLLSADLVVHEQKGHAIRGRKSNTYPDHSKLANGDWYRFSVAEDGVYKLDYAFLQELGVQLNGLASDQINVYGDHFGQLPWKNSDTRPTDLIVNAVQMEDGGDGQFGPNDYMLFYATGPHRWALDTVTKAFVHSKNAYSDSADYFIGIGVDPPQRIANVALSSDPATDQITEFSDRQFIEHDAVNLIKSGRQFFGEVFDMVDVYNYSFSFPNLHTNSLVRVIFSGAARTVGTGVSSSFTWTVGSSPSSTVVVNGIGTGYTGPFAAVFTDTIEFLSSSITLPVTVTFNPHDPITSVGWANYLEANVRRDMKFTGDQMAFRDIPSFGPGHVGEFVLDQASNVYRIWEISDPTNVRNVPYTDGGTQKTFRVPIDSLREFIAFRNTDYLAPTAIGRVPNQDLHAIQNPVDLVIVSHPDFVADAQRLANRRESEGLAVQILTPQQVFNEFSCGARDATAIKRFMKMLYDRAGADSTMMPRYLLLFGDGSYNNLSLSSSNQNMVPTYETANSWDLSRSYTSDDYFALLDDAESESPGDLVDIGVGRLVASDRDQSRQLVDKILNYDKLTILSTPEQSCNAGGDGGANDWRTWVVFASDDQEGDNFEGVIHMQQSDQLATTLTESVENTHPQLNVDKIYLDAYQQFSTPGGERYPDAETALRDRVQKGALLVNYIGHGGEVGWAHERLLDNTTILGWTNFDRLPLFMTATCEFTRWDDPARTSAGEYVLLNPSGGGVGLMSTTRLAYSNQNFNLSRDFYSHVFSTEDELGRTQRLGDVYRQTKRDATDPNQTNHRVFMMLGDPSMRLAQARMQVLTTSITDTLGNAVDTLEALATVRVNGIIADENGNQLTDFSGIVIPTVFDKRSSQSTLANDGGSPFNYTVRKSILYRGKASVTNGAFTFTFVVPKDIAYQVGPGRISYYAESLTTNAGGYTHDPLVGGTADGVAADEAGPHIDLFMNDDQFVPGGITNEDPLLFAKLFDHNGINTTGNSIGHDLMAILDENTEDEVVLNDYYEADLDTYQSGKVRYRYADLAEGTHTLTLKAWDVFNNSSMKSTEFVVASSEELALAHVLNYPNPFTTHTEFYFEHNRPCVTLDVQVQVYTVSGRLVKTINRSLSCEGFRAEPLAWDGLDDEGDRLGRGVYVYRLNVTTPEGDNAEKFEKLVILR